jgi:redox-sensitive bicupin YhaK (pirin superfamily)
MIELRQPGERFHTELGWLDSWHSFSFGQHYDPNEQGHGLLLVNNDDRVEGNRGFGTHGHADMEIVTWVLSGQLEHQDSTGAHGVLYPGLAQRMSAGTGVRHSEMNPSAEEAHFVQMWVAPDTRGIAPSYEQRDVNDDLAGGGLVAVASGQDHEGALHIQQRDAVLWVGRLSAGEHVVVPESPHAHVFVALGSAELEGAGQLVEGAAARLTSAGSPGLTAGAAGAEVLVWTTS